jgi:hypothetical protein
VYFDKGLFGLKRNGNGSSTGTGESLAKTDLVKSMVCETRMSLLKNTTWKVNAVRTR